MRSPTQRKGTMNEMASSLAALWGRRMWTGEDDTAAAAPGGHELFQRRFALLAEMSSDGICVHQEGRIVFANAAAIRWMGVAPEVGLIGRRVAEFVHQTSYPEVKRRLDGLQHDGDSAPAAEVVLGRPQKAARDVRVTSTRIDWDGSPAVVTNFRDLTAVKASAVLKYQAALLDHVSDAVIGVSHDGTVTSWNAAAELIYRRDAQHALQLPVDQAVGAPLDAERLAKRDGALHTTHVAADGFQLSVRVFTAATDNGYVVICADLTALRRAERHFEAVVTAIDTGVIVFNPDGSVESANPTARRIFDGVAKSLAPFAGDMPLIDVDGRPMADDRRPLSRAVLSGAPQIDRVVGVRRIDGQIVWLSVSARMLGADHPGQAPVLCSFVDVTAQKVASERLLHEAGHDALTGLPNRSSALARITESLAPGALQRVSAVMFIDMDNLKSINDSYGHGAGDTVLVTAATRMGGALRDGDVIARLAGDEFVVLLCEQVDRPAVNRVADALHRAVSTPIRYCDVDITATSSIGVTMVETGDVRDPLQLLCAADEAMYAAKAEGPGRTRYAP